METVPISQFKARCLAILARVKKTGKPVLVTRFGVPVAEVVPPSSAPAGKRRLGTMKGRGKILGDIVSPVVAEEEWEVLRP